MRLIALISCCVAMLQTVQAAEVELNRGGTVAGWVTVRTGWQNQPVVSVAGDPRHWQFDLLDIKRITVKEPDHVLATRRRDLRERPNDNTKSVALVFPGFEFKVLKDEGAWLQVQGFNEAETGYIPKEATGREVRFSTVGPAPAEHPSDATAPADASPTVAPETPRDASPEKPSHK